MSRRHRTNWAGGPLRRAVFMGVVVAMLCASGSAVSAQQPVPTDIAQALGYLASGQQGNGSFPSANPIATDDQTTARVASALVGSLGNAAELAAAVAYLDAQPFSLVELRARRLLAGGSASDVVALQAVRNSDGGLGSEAGFASTTLDTAIATAALRFAGAPFGVAGENVAIPAAGAVVYAIDVPSDATLLEILIEQLSGTIELRIRSAAPPDGTEPFFTISAGNTIISINTGTTVPLVPGTTHYIEVASAGGATVSFTANFVAPSGDSAPQTAGLVYLLAARNTDGGWGLIPNDDASLLYYSYWAARALGVGFDASAFALTRVQSGGGFGDGTVAEVFETAVGLQLLGLGGVDATSVAATSISFLEGSQQPNGSFADDPYRSAWAVEALAAARPPLAASVTSNGGAGAGADFVTHQGVVTLTGVAPFGASGISVDVPGAVVSFDPLTGAYSITLTLAEGANSITITATNLAGVAGPGTPLTITLNSSLVGQDIQLQEGLNAVGLTVDPANPVDAIDLLEMLGPQTISIQRHDAVSGLFDEVSRDGSGGYTGTDFPLAGLDALHLLASAPVSTSLTGTTAAGASLDLVAGTNLLTFTAPPAGLGAFTLLALLGDETVVSALQRFDPTTGRYQTAVYEGASPAGVDFPIEPAVSYLLSLLQPINGFQPPVALTVTIASPTEASVLSVSPVLVSGSVTGVPPLTVDVNGVAATVVGSSFSASVPLVEGANVLTATASDAVSSGVTDVVNVTLQSVDYSLQAGGSVNDSRIVSAASSVISQVASVQFSVIGLPPELSYTLTGVFIQTATEVRFEFQIGVAGGAAPGIYSFQVVNDLLDSGGVPLGPVTGNVFDFSVEATP